MPRLRFKVPKYRKHRASGQAIVTLGGIDHYLGPHGTKASKSFYERLIAEYLASNRMPPVSTGKSNGEQTVAQIAVVEVLAAFWIYCKGYYRKNGRATNEQDAFRLVIRDIKDGSLEELVGDEDHFLGGLWKRRAPRESEQQSLH